MSERAASTGRGLAVLLALAVLAELAAWFLGGGAGTATFAWYRISAHAGTGGLLACALAGLAAATLAWAALRSRPQLGTLLQGGSGLGLLAMASLLWRLAYLDLPQAQPDAVIYFVQAQRVALHPLETLLGWPAEVWSGPEAAFHRPFPLVPLIFGLVFRVFGERWAVVQLLMAASAVVLPLAVAWVGRSAGRPGLGLAAGWLALGLPFLQAQTGWLLVDVPLLVLLCLAWGAMLRARSPLGVALALLACAPALASKASAGLFLLGPLAALLTQRHLARRWMLPLLALLGLGILAWLHPPRLREDPSTWIEAVWATMLQLRPALWLLAMPALGSRQPMVRQASAVLLALPVLVLWAPPEHAARYALPLGLALCLLVAGTLRRFPWAIPGLVASGLALSLLGYRPLLVHHQAANLQQAVRILEARQVRSIELWADHPGSEFTPEALAALVDIYASVPVWVGGTLRQGNPDEKRHWWEVYQAPPWHAPDPERPPAEGVLLCLFDARASEFEQGPGAGLVFWEEVSLYRASSELLPQRVRVYLSLGSRGLPGPDPAPAR
jgi:hypothetical protein